MRRGGALRCLPSDVRSQVPFRNRVSVRLVGERIAEAIQIDRGARRGERRTYGVERNYAREPVGRIANADAPHLDIAWLGRSSPVPRGAALLCLIGVRLHRRNAVERPVIRGVHPRDAIVTER